MIYANIATIPERVDIIHSVIRSIINQVDVLNIRINNYSNDLKYGYFDDSPYIAHENSKVRDNDGFYVKKILYEYADNKMGDGEKFYNIEHQKGYIFTIDDDLLYPPDYVETMIDHIERHKRKAIISLHGRTFGKHPIESYYRDKTKKGYHWNRDQDCDILVDSGGTGVMAWHSDTIKVKYEDIKHPNMGDVWMAVFARKAGVPIMCVKHKANWLKYIGPPEDIKHPKTIWAKHVWNDANQTKIYNDGC